MWVVTHLGALLEMAQEARPWSCCLSPVPRRQERPGELRTDRAADPRGEQGHQPHLGRGAVRHPARRLHVGTPTRTKTPTHPPLRRVIQMIDENKEQLRNLFRNYNVLDVQPAITARAPDDLSALQVKVQLELQAATPRPRGAAGPK